MKKPFRSKMKPRRWPLRLVLVVPFVLLTLGAVSLVGYFSYRNGEMVVAELAEEIRTEIAARIEQKLTDHLETPLIVNRVNVDALESGLIDAQNLSGLQGYLMRQLQQFPTLSGITIATEKPDYIGILYAEDGSMVLSRWNRSQGGLIDSKIDAQGRILSSTLDSDYDHRQRSWYRNAVIADRPFWQGAYLTLNPARLVISADATFQDEGLLGVVNAEVKLSSLSEFLGSLKIGQTGATFIIEQDGLLIASSADEPPFDLVDGEQQRRSALDSKNPQIQAATRFLSEKFGDLHQIDRPHQMMFNRNGTPEFLTVMPFGRDLGINWLVAVVVPKSDFTRQIAASNRNTLLLCLATLLAAIALGLRTSRWIAEPLLRMSRASRSIAAGEFNQRVPVDLPVTELDVMAQSFNQMARQMGQSFERVNEALQASEAKFTKVFRASPDAIAITTVSSGRYLDVNTSFCRISGYDRAEIIGRTPFDLQFPLTPEGFTRFGKILRQRRTLHNVEVAFRTKTGEAKTALVSAELIEIEGEPRILAVIKDISDRKRAEAERRRIAQERKQIALELERAKEAAEAASRAKSQFLAHMSHELRSPLNAILGFTQLMALSHQLPADHREYVDIIQRSGEHLLQLINDILDSSKIEAGRLTLDESCFDLHRLLQELLEMFQLKAQDRSIALKIDRAPALPQWICADELKLRQVLINLIGNAIKFTQSGSVTVKVVNGQHSAPTTLHFSVVDTGIGIDRDRLDTIFEVFVQTASGRQTAEGTGLGLSISQGFVQLMGGNITVQSEVGQGSVFEFAIPVGITTPPLPSEAFRCLVGLDDRDRPLLLALLRSLGYRIREVSSGEEIVALWKTWQPHFIWLDLQLPAGIDALRQICALGSNSPPVIFAIGDAEAQSIAQAAGCSDFLVRPLHKTQVRVSIKKYLDSNDQNDAAPVAVPDLTHLRQQLALLPNSWIARLHQAALEGDRDWMLSLVAEIRPQHEFLAEAIARLANHFQYVQLLTLTQPTQPPERTT
ncbi:PAS domain S-box protein [Microcoleus sp. FACHB-1515]|uniref:hybrid sensor histidine kinase/response regulator n=1 Tax=Cyanophyceae TaxID=3028117 RepID=UPI00168276D7|nr:ATP-binding protein [Microcoleus sp. FACHB-1515]MBD2091183.1 PAS domain S-box protein [Microcoleus sp. FACHB-1515]